MVKNDANFLFWPLQRQISRKYRVLGYNEDRGVDWCWTTIVNCFCCFELIFSWNLIKFIWKDNKWRNWSRWKIINTLFCHYDWPAFILSDASFQGGGGVNEIHNACIDLFTYITTLWQEHCSKYNVTYIIWFPNEI